MISLDLQLKSLAQCLSAQKIKYAVIGGIAVFVYGEPRFTADIDVNIILESRKIEDFLKQAKKYGFLPRSPRVRRIAQKDGVIPLFFKKSGLIGRIDIILAENPLEYSGINRAETRKVSAVKVKLVTPEDLILHKITSQRPRDKEDIRGILIRQKGRLDLRYIRSWLVKIDKANSTKLLSRFNGLLKKII
ncbi:MAG: nucleotidyltransferase [Candidatus Omnitrophica bacterium]|nr:nucleotidyltransferase [Candidatus Omnitrophota bacterium]MBU4488254.1 nucleotidyltransferase [Candidatus Omnitrophota bacterium]MCG2704702.1 nucleotidyltransferase [Candidatus Omnitrophota bacterium]